MMLRRLIDWLTFADYERAKSDVTRRTVWLILANREPS